MSFKKVISLFFLLIRKALQLANYLFACGYSILLLILSTFSAAQQKICEDESGEGR